MLELGKRAACVKGFHECGDLDDASEGRMGELPSPQGAMKRGGEMGDGSKVSSFDFKKDFVYNGAMEVVGEVIKTSRAEATKPAMTSLDFVDMHFIMFADFGTYLE